MIPGSGKPLRRKIRFIYCCLGISKKVAKSSLHRRFVSKHTARGRARAATFHPTRAKKLVNEIQNSNMRPGGAVEKDVHAPTASDTEPKLKKKKSVMGRLKSTLSTKLARRKSSSGDIVTSPTDKDLSDRHGAPEISGPGSNISSTRGRVQQQDDEEDEYPDEYEVDDAKRSCSTPDSSRDPADRTDSMTTNAVSPFDLKNMLTAKTPTMHLEQLPDTDETDEGLSDESTPDQHIHGVNTITRASPIRLAQTQPPNFSEMEDEEEDGAQQGDEKEEVFAADYNEEKVLPQFSPNVDDDDDDQLEVFQNGNQYSVESEVSGPDQSLAEGLMVIGRSPAKLARLSPEKRARPLSLSQVPEIFPPPECPDACPTIPSPVKNSRTSPMPSPIKQVRSSPMPSPAKPGRSSPMPSPNKGMPAVPIQTEPMERIAEEDKAGSPMKPLRASPAGTRRRSSIKMDAPILASSFVVNPADDDISASEAIATAVQQDSDGLGQRDEARAKVLEDTSVFAFDAGAAITQAFGDRVARLLGADPWGDRQDGFDAIQFAIRKTDLGAAVNKRELLCAALAAIQCGVEDRVAPVMYCALECLRAVLKEYASVLDRSFSKFSPLNEQLSSLLQALVGKLSDANKRTQREAAQAIARLTKLRKLRALPHVLLHLSGKDVSPRLQLEMMRRLVQDVGLGASPAEGGKASQYPQLTLEVIMQFVSPSLKIADDKTRKASVELLADLHVATSPAAVNGQLAGLKPDLLRVITRRVEELVAQRLLEKQQQQQESARNQSDETNVAEEEDAKRAAELLVPLMAEDSRAATALLDEQLNAASNIVGPVIWRKLLSKTWSDRKEALVDLGRAVTDAKSDLRDAKPAFGSIIQNNYCAYCVIAHKFLGDSIQPVVNEALELLTTLIKIFGSTVEWREDVVRDLTLLTLNRLFQTMQKPQNRTTRAACRCVLKLARLPNSRHPLRYTLSCVFTKETDPSVQMHLLRLLVPELGFQPEGLSASMVLGVTATALNNSSDKIRKVAADVALATQRLVGRALVLEKLKDVKPATLKELEKSFVDVERDSTERPQTVHAVGPAVGALPPVNFSSDRSRRQLNSAPVGVGKLQCFPQGQEEEDTLGFEINTEIDSIPARTRGSVLSNDEENLMDSILGGDEF